MHLMEARILNQRAPTFWRRRLQDILFATLAFLFIILACDVASVALDMIATGLRDIQEIAAHHTKVIASVIRYFLP